METPKPQTENDLLHAAELERVFLADELIPDAAAAFASSFLGLEDAVKTADIVFDASTLLLPYRAKNIDYSHFVKVLQHLREKRSLFLPAQVAREFIQNRPEMLANLQQQILDTMNRDFPSEKMKFPFMDGTIEYARMNEALEKSAAVRKEISEAGQALAQLVRSWEWNDPVHIAYSKVFSSDNILELSINREQALAELKRRHMHSIPPGYKDKGKDDLGVGDFLVWMTILELGGRNKKPVVLISEDEKADWHHDSRGKRFLTRFELLDEFRRRSGGQPLYIIPLGKLLHFFRTVR